MQQADVRPSRLEWSTGGHCVAQRLRRWSPIALALVLAGCFSAESEQEAEASYALNVENCVCRFLATEEDNYSGLTYEAIVEECNEVARTGNPLRYPDTFISTPRLESLHCDLQRREWIAVVDEELRRQDLQRELHEQHATPTE